MVLNVNIPGRSSKEDHLNALMTAVDASKSEAAVPIHRDTNVYGGISASSCGFV